MRMKAVCEATGLSDRTVRYYIEEGLIAPKYTENYLGRKNFDFSQQDIRALKKVSVLRSYDFSVEEIRGIIQDSTKSQKIIDAVIQRIEKTVTDGENKLSVLMKLDKEKPYTFPDLSEMLTNISYNAAIKSEKIQKSLFKMLCEVLKRIIIFIIVWFPVFLSAYILLGVRVNYYYYPVYSLKGFLFLLLFLLPTILMLVISKIQFRWRKLVKQILLILCIISVPFCVICSAFGLITGSETDDIRNYREFDVRLGLNTSVEFDELFPKYPHTYDRKIQEDGRIISVPVDAKYYYRYICDFDSTYDVYAEWELSEDDFYNEINRVEQIFEKNALQEEQPYIYYDTIQKGNYTCLIRYENYGNNQPFETATDNYDYLIFAYDEQNHIVRYICCYSLQNGAEQPYYLSLQW